MRQRSGFTLLELLVVIAIVSVLIVMVMPALRGTREAAKRTRCTTNLHQIGVALRTYLSDNRDRLPFASFMPSIGPAPLSTSKPVRIAAVLGDELGGEGAVFHCPNDDEGRRRPAPNEGRTYFESEGSSYEYRSRIGGQTMTEVVAGFERFIDRSVAENSIWIMRDYDNFHAPAGKPGARRYLYIDGHVTDYEN